MLGPPRLLSIGTVLILFDPPLAYTCSIWPQERLVLPARPQDTREYEERAQRLGYVDDGEETAGTKMSREHEYLHHYIAVRLDSLPYSPTLHAAARGEDYPVAGAEEGRVLAFQALLNGAAEGVPLSWDPLVAEAKALLRGA